MLIFPGYFDGRPCSFRRSPEVLGRPGGPSRELLGACVWPLGALGGVLGEARTRLEGPRGGLDTEFGDPRGKCMMAKYTIIHIFLRYFDDFPKQRVFQRRAPGALVIFNDKLKNGGFRTLGSLGPSRSAHLVFFSAWGGPLGAAKACNMAKFDGNTGGFLMILLFVSSGLGGVPGGVKISCLGPMRAEGPLPKS